VVRDVSTCCTVELVPPLWLSRTVVWRPSSLSASPLMATSWTFPNETSVKVVLS